MENYNPAITRLWLTMESQYKINKRRTKPFTFITIAILYVVSLAHLLRFFFGLEITVNGAYIPMWASALGFVIAGGLAIMLQRELIK